jgi:hypothetical protein
MQTFTERELITAQIVGAAVAVLGLLMGSVGAFCLKHGFGTPEYITCLRNSGWTLLLLAAAWITLASWRRLTR